jgi:hypothetical protein
MLTLPLATTSNRSAAIASRCARVAAYDCRVGRVIYSEPRAASSFSENGGTGPDELPKLTISPRGRRQSSERVNMSLPTES